MSIYLQLLCFSGEFWKLIKDLEQYNKGLFKQNVWILVRTASFVEFYLALFPSLSPDICSNLNGYITISDAGKASSLEATGGGKMIWSAPKSPISWDCHYLTHVSAPGQSPVIALVFIWLDSEFAQ